MFILYFVLASVVTTVSIHLGISGAVFGPMKTLSKFLIVLAMAAIGLNTNLVDLVKKGGKPISSVPAAGLASPLSVSSCSMLWDSCELEGPYFFL